MNPETIIAICAVIGLLISLVNIAIALATRSSIQEYINKQVEKAFVDVKQRFDGYSRRIRELELGKVGAESDAREVFLTKDDFDKLDRKRDHQLELINNAVDAVKVEVVKVKTLVEERTRHHDR
jgi:arginine repressor